MSEATFRAALFTVVKAVANIGQVYDYGRWTVEWDKFIERFKTEIGGENQIRAWMIEYAGMPESTIPEMGPVRGKTLRTHDFRIRGVLGLNDEDQTEKTAATLAETVASALDDASGIDAVSGFYYAEPARILVFEVRTFGSALCHYMEIQQRITEFRSG